MTSDALQLSPRLRNRVTARLGLPAALQPDLTGLRAVYAAWCAAVPFDNVRKMMALAAGGSRSLPGRDASDFFEHWLDEGVGGTCWPSSLALCALLQALGFDARLVAGSMRDLGVISHASVKVRVGGGDWLVDSSMLTGAPLPLGNEVFISPDPVFAAEVEPVGGTWVIWADLPPNREYLPCRLLVDPADTTFCLASYEASREHSPFNQRLYARRNRPGELLVLFGRTRLSKTPAGVTTRDLSGEEVCRTLRDDFGLSAALIDAWVASGGLETSLASASGPPPPAPERRPPSARRP